MQRIIFILFYTFILSACETSSKNTLGGNKSQSLKTEVKTTDTKTATRETKLNTKQESSSGENPAQKQNLDIKPDGRRSVATSSTIQCTQFYQNEFSPGLLVLNTPCDPKDTLCIGFTQTVYNNCDSQDNKKLIRYICNCTITDGNNSCEPKQEPLFLEREITCDQYCENDICVR